MKEDNVFLFQSYDFFPFNNHKNFNATLFAFKKIDYTNKKIDYT